MNGVDKKRNMPPFHVTHRTGNQPAAFLIAAWKASAS